MKNKPLYIERYKPVMLVLLGIISILPFVYFTKYSFPYADDYYFDNLARQENYFLILKELYFNYNGRFTASAFQILVKINDNYLFYRLMNLSIIVIFIFIIILFFKTLGTTFVKAIMISSGFLFIFLYQMPTVAQGFYWLTASMAYTLSLISISFIALLYFKFKQTKKNIYYFLLILTIVLNAGYNESAAISIFVITMGLVFYERIVNRKFLSAELVFWGSSIIGLLIAALSPGNFHRENTEMNNHLILNIYYLVPFVKNAFIDTISFCLKWLNSPLIPTTLLFVPILGNELKKNTKIEIKSISIYFWVLIFVVTLFAMFLPAHLFLGHSPWQRIQNVIYFVFLIFWFSISTMIYIKHSNLFSLNSFSFIAIYFFLLFSIKNTNVSTNQIGNAYSDLFNGKCVDYSSQMNDRLILLNNKVQQKIILRPIKNPPLTIFPGDISCDDKDFTNIMLAKYYDKIKINLKQCE